MGVGDRFSLEASLGMCVHAHTRSVVSLIINIEQELTNYVGVILI